MSPKQKPKVDLVIPVFNEVGVIEQFYKQISAVLDGLSVTFNIYFVDDGSTDRTVDSLRAIADSDPRVTVLTLSRNFGHQAALTAGLDRATGNVIITLDGDGEHPCELISQMIELIDMGYDVVLTQREDAEAQRSITKRLTSTLFYS